MNVFTIPSNVTKLSDHCFERYNSLTEIKRLETINKYFEKMQNTKKDKDKEYFLEGIKLMLSEGETIDNYKQILKEYTDALESKEENIDRLEKILTELK